MGNTRLGGSQRGGVDNAGVGGSCWGEVGHAGVGWVMLEWGRCGACRSGVGHARVGWVMQGWGGVGHAGMGSGGSYRGGMGLVMKNFKILNYWCYRVSNPANQNQIYRVLNFLNHGK